MKNIKKMNLLNPIKFGRHKFKWLLTTILVISGFGAQAQSSDNSAFLLAFTLGLVVFVAILVLVVAIYTLQIIKAVIKDKEAKIAEVEDAVAAEETVSWWSKILHVANDRVDMEEEDAILLDHNYDGIRELDNHLPPWWTYLFYLTIIFGIIYVFAYHVTETLPLQEEEYNMEIAEAQAEAEARLAANVEAGGFDEASLEYSDDPAILESGKSIYVRMCAACHKEDGGGSIGPNLTDNYWIHGASIQDIYTTIKVGVPDKGMISWESQLSPVQMRDVSSYIISLKGTNPPAAKGPQGDLVE